MQSLEIAELRSRLTEANERRIEIFRYLIECGLAVVPFEEIEGVKTLRRCTQRMATIG